LLSSRRVLWGMLMRLPLDSVQVAYSCPVSWQSMEGDERVRFCSQCRQHVHNLSAMTAEQATSLLEERQGNLCVRFCRRWDGRIITADCRIGFHDFIRNPLRWWTAALMTMLAVLLPGCSTTTQGPPMPPASSAEQREQPENRAKDQLPKGTRSGPASQEAPQTPGVPRK
jgi:hypothetical protein